ncbi:amino acid ABC transporter permease, partial [Chromobacterium piscinae]
MNYHWDWGIFFKPTGVGSEIYLNWFASGLGWTLAVALSGWLIALLLGTVVGVARTLPNR